MEFNDKKNHYLHPDFEDKVLHDEKKLSPLALLAQTCKNIGSIKDNREFPNNVIITSPNSTMNEFRKLSKRCHSECSSETSNLDRNYLSPMKKKSTFDNNICKKNESDVADLRSLDTSSEASFSSNSSLITGLLQFVKKSNSSSIRDFDKSDLLHFLAGQYGDAVTNQNNVKTKDYSNKLNQFNVSKGYHLETPEEQYFQREKNSPKKFPENPISVHNPVNMIDNTKAISAIKYCMYCGKFIPILPLLLAHIRLEHGSTTFSETNADNSLNSPISNMYDFSKFNPHHTSQPTKPPPLSFLTDFISSSFHGLNNLIC